MFLGVFVMKRSLRIITLFFATILCFCCFSGCNKMGAIPNGYYCWSSAGENIYEFTESNIRDFFGWEIKGDTAKRWTSSSVDYKAKIVERDGKIYFEGYKWKDSLYSLTSCASQKVGSETIYEVIYNEAEKTIILKNENFLESNQIYSIKEVYDNNYITYGDLLNIAYYSGNEGYNPNEFEKFIPKDKGVMDEETIINLKTKLVELHNEKVSKEENKATIDDFIITYYGCYNGFCAFKSRNIEESDPAVIIEEWETIGGIRFKYASKSSKSRIKLWKI